VTETWGIIFVVASGILGKQNNNTPGSGDGTLWISRGCTDLFRMVTWSNTPTHETPTLGTSVLQIVLLEDLTRRIASPDVIVSCPEWRVALTLKEPVPVSGNPTPSSVLSALGDLPETPRFTSTLAWTTVKGLIFPY
jgi:hypothetical protein